MVVIRNSTGHDSAKHGGTISSSSSKIARRVRQSGNKQVVLVAVIGYGQAEDTKRALAARFDRYLVKPVKHQELARIIAEAFASGK